MLVVRNTTVDGVMEVVATQLPVNTYTSHVLDHMEISPENLSGGWEIESGGIDVPDHVAVRGRLKEHFSFWKDTIRVLATICLFT